MATIAVAKVSGADSIHARTYLWEALVSGSVVGASIEIPDHADKTVQVVGTFDSESMSLQGSNDGTNWEVLTDPLGNALTFAATGLKQVMENTRFVRPLGDGGGAGSEDLDVYLHVRQQR